MRRATLPRVGAALVVFLTLAGCQDNKAVVTGQVLVNGQPAQQGMITFTPTDGKTGPEGGLIGKDGRYSVKSALGPMKVSISVPREIGKKKIYPTPDSPEMPITAESLPDRFNKNTELTFDVKPGKNEKDWKVEAQ